MAILKFRAYFQEDESIYRDIAIKHTSSFFELHSAILIAFEFDNKHAATFYRSNDEWLRGREISVKKYDKAYKVEPLVMAETVISTEVKDTNQRFIYEYDFERSWLFAIELISVEKTESDKMYYPLCVRTEGVAPPQYGSKGLVDKRLAEMEEKYDLKPSAMDDGYGTEGEDGDDTDMAEDDAEVPGDEYGEEI
jgi:hypothetical protein